MGGSVTVTLDVTSVCCSEAFSSGTLGTATVGSGPWGTGWATETDLGVAQRPS